MTDTPAAPELLPCPFCGGQPRAYPHGVFESIACVNEGCPIDEPQTDVLSFPEAVAAWNTRVDLSEARVKELEAALRFYAYGGHLIANEVGDIASAALEKEACVPVDHYLDLAERADLSEARVKELEAEVERLREALEYADTYLTKIQTPGTEPLNSLNCSTSKKDRGFWTAQVRNEAREIWAILGNVLHHGKTVKNARAALEGE